MIIGVGIWLVATMLIIDFFAGAAERNKENNIILRPLDLEKSNIKVTLMLEIKKCMEEDKEFVKGALSNDIGNTIEEFWDSVQTKLNVMSMLGIPTDIVYKGLIKHTNKMKDRGYIFKE